MPTVLMPALSIYDGLLIGSCLASIVGLSVYCQPQSENPTEAEAIQETLVRMTFVYWVVYCVSHWGEKLCGAVEQPVVCSLHLLAVLSFILTFCCTITLPLHLIEQRQRSLR